MPDNETMTGGEAVVRALEALDVEHVFGIVSVHNLPIFDALAASGTVELVPSRHEQGAVHAADGYARATGRLGVAVTSTGPGAANAMGGLFEANTASSPVLMITGQVPSTDFGKGRGALHEAEKQVEMLRTVCRAAEHVDRHADIAPTITRVARDILTGRRRPGAIEIPIDLQHASGPTGMGEPGPPPPQPPDPALVDRASAALAAAARPLIWAGGGVVAADASQALIDLAEALGAPVVTTVNGRGAIPEDHPLALGPNTDQGAMDPVIAGADVVLAVGTRFQQDNRVHAALTVPGELIHLDVDPAVIGRVHRTRHPLRGDAALGLVALREALGEVVGRPEDGWVETTRAVRQQIEEVGRDAMGPDHARVVDCIRAHLPREGIVVKDATVAAIVWAHRHLAVFEPRTSLRPTAMGIGPAVPLAVGAAVGTGRPTVVIQGDGGLMLSLGELAVAAEQHLPVVVCVFNDRGYGILRWIQDRMMGGRRSGVDLVTPDLAALAASMGLRSATISSIEEFEQRFPEAVTSGAPWLLDIDLSTLAEMQIVPQTPSTR